MATDVFVDSKGVMRWPGNNKEVNGFGINYTVPFAYAYRSARRMGVNVEQEIDADVYHFARLGFDAFRLHVWDTEISDTLGNLIDNDHLRLFDYLLWKMKQRNMYFLITPIAYWGNGWPEPDEKTPGFSAKYGKDKCLTDPDAIKAQENYLYQFLNHVNRYTGVAYKNEPNIVAFEISNEPHHHGAPDSVTAFIKRMKTSMQSTGCKKPVFYNISHSIDLEQAYFNAGIQGGTFQWYPTGLGFKQELEGNYLPNVDDYHIPFTNNDQFKKIAKVVYEFDAADIGRSYVYPAMARSFRTAGIQWATHFAYDPTFLAYANTEYDTHFMNLVYAPQKALSLMIAGEVFHRVPRYKSYGIYPADTSFDGFHVSYKDDLAELVTAEKFIYTNNTVTNPDDGNLKLIAGYGNSPLVKYSGTGAYFLDKIREGIWRLEVLPDAIWVNDPFGRNSPKKTNVVVNWRANTLQLNMSDLKDGFNVTGVNASNYYYQEAVKNEISITPGTYVVRAAGVSKRPVTDTSFSNNIRLNEFNAPATTVQENYIVHQPVNQITQGNPLTISAVVVGPELPQSVQLYITGNYRMQPIVMQQTKPYYYSATVPASLMQEGYLKYNIVVKQKGASITYPGGENTAPGDWDFYSTNTYVTAVVKSDAPVYLFNAFEDASSTIRNWLPGSGLVPAANPNTALLQLNIEKLAFTDPENKNATPIADYSMRFYFRNIIAGRLNDIDSRKAIVIKGKSLNGKPCTMRLSLITSDGATYGALVRLDTTNKDYTVPISLLTSSRQVLLPRPYPSFLPYYFSHGEIDFDINKIESVQVSIGEGIDDESLLTKNGIAIETIRLE